MRFLNLQLHGLIFHEPQILLVTHSFPF